MYQREWHCVASCVMRTQLLSAVTTSSQCQISGFVCELLSIRRWNFMLCVINESFCCWVDGISTQSLMLLVSSSVVCVCDVADSFRREVLSSSPATEQTMLSSLQQVFTFLTLTQVALTYFTVPVAFHLSYMSYRTCCIETYFPHNTSVIAHTFNFI